MAQDYSKIIIITIKTHSMYYFDGGNAKLSTLHLIEIEVLTLLTDNDKKRHINTPFFQIT